MSAPDAKTTIEALVARYRREAAKSDGSSSPELEVRFQNVDYDNFAAIYGALLAGRASDGAPVAVGPGALSQTVSASMAEQRGRGEAVRSDGRRPLRAKQLRVISFVDGTKTSEEFVRKEDLMFPFNVPGGLGLAYRVALASEARSSGTSNDANASIRIKARVSFLLTLTATGSGSSGIWVSGPNGDKSDTHPHPATANPDLLWRVDMTVVREIPGSAAQDLKSIVKQMFKTQPAMAPDNFLSVLGLVQDDSTAVRQLYDYEVEVEFMGPPPVRDALQPADVFAAADTVLRLANPERLCEAALQAEIFRAAAFVVGSGNVALLQKYRHERGLKQLLPQAMALTRAEYRKLFPPRGFFVTDKADGTRALALARGGKGVIASTALFEFTSADTTGPSGRVLADAAGDTILDGEYVDTDGQKTFYAFDVIAVNGQDLTQLGFEERKPYIETGVKFLCAAGVPAFTKEVRRIQDGEAAELERTILEVHKAPRKYKKDGIMFIEPGKPYSETTSYKWKSAEDNTIDCLVRRVPASVLGKPPYLDKPGFALHFLFVGVSPGLYSALGLTRCPGYEALFPGGPGHDTSGYFPIQFTPSDAPLAYLYWHPVLGPQPGKGTIPDEIDGKVLEMRCTGGCIVAGAGDGFACWEIVRVREDRRRELASGRYYGNDFRVAEMIWLNYLDPFPLQELWEGPGARSFLRTKAGVYRAQTAAISYVKSQLIKSLKHEAWVVDVGIGKGQDLGRYLDAEVQNLVAVDSDRAALSELVRKKYALAEKRRQRRAGPRVSNSSTTVYVLAANVSAPFGETLKLFKGVGLPNSTADALVCNLAVHYFLSDISAMRNFIVLVRHTVKIGGQVVLTVFLGEEVHALFKANKVPVNGTWDVFEANGTGDQGTRKYSVKRLYSSDVLEAAGQRIGVLHPFSDGEYYEEYLVNVKVLTKEFENHNFGRTVFKRVEEYLPDFELHNPTLARTLTQGDKKYLKLYGALVFVRKV